MPVRPLHPIGKRPRLVPAIIPQEPRHVPAIIPQEQRIIQQNVEQVVEEPAPMTQEASTQTVEVPIQEEIVHVPEIIQQEIINQQPEETLEQELARLLDEVAEWQRSWGRRKKQSSSTLLVCALPTIFPPLPLPLSMAITTYKHTQQ